MCEIPSIRKNAVCLVFLPNKILKLFFTSACRLVHHDDYKIWHLDVPCWKPGNWNLLLFFRKLQVDLCINYQTYNFPNAASHYKIVCQLVSSASEAMLPIRIRPSMCSVLILPQFMDHHENWWSEPWEITHTTINFANAHARVEFLAVLVDQLLLPFSCFCQYNRVEVWKWMWFTDAIH